MKGLPVLVTTAHRGVFFGYAHGSTGGKTIKLKAARCCIYWPRENKGFLGLANAGPVKGARVWVVAMHGEIVEDGDKMGALKREIIGECLPP